MNLYEENGYLAMNKIIEMKNPFIFIVGGRGIGKTYGAVKYVIEHDIKFMLSRRTQKQADIISVPEMSPLKSPCDDLGVKFTCTPIIDNCSGIYIENSIGEISLRGYTTALSTISSIRGFDSSDVKLWLYDEFIPERHERALKLEGEGFLNAYETINRNRELNGEQPLKCVCMSNSNDIGSPIFETLGLMEVIEKMERKQQEIYINNERGIIIILPRHSPISDRKKNTALYKAVSADSRFAQMSIGNAFEIESCINSRPLNEYKLIVSIGTMHIYKHKFDRWYYVSDHKAGTAPVYSVDRTSIIQFRTAYRNLQAAYLTDTIEFENIRLKRNFEEIFTIKT